MIEKDRMPMNHCPDITLCMIVRNEEDVLSSCLASAAPLVEEIVVVDTGSSDRTKEIAKQYTEQVIDFKWHDDFAQARNFALKQASREWVLWLDADEEIRLEDEQEWTQSFLKASAAYDALLVPLRNYYGETPDETKAYLYSSYRLLRASAGFQFKQAIHEHLDIASGSNRYAEAPLSGMCIRHYGYLDAYVQKKDKIHRNLHLLLKEKSRPGYDPWIDYHIANELYQQRDYSGAFEHVNLAIRRFIDHGRLPPSLAYKLKYEILLITESLDHALEGIEKAIMLYPDYVDLHYYKGLITYRNGCYTDAIDVFTRCMEMGENCRHLVLHGTGSYMSEYMIGMSQEAMGEMDKAIGLYERLMRKYPGFEAPRERLEVLKEITEN